MQLEMMNKFSVDRVGRTPRSDKLLPPLEADQMP